MRMSDWSSDVCSSDLQLVELVAVEFGHPRPPPHRIGHDKTTISDPMQSVRTLGSGPINCVVVTEAGKMAGQGASAGHSSAMAQSSNAVPALSRPALRVSPCRSVAASTRLDGATTPPSTLLLGTNPHGDRQSTRLNSSHSCAY